MKNNHPNYHQEKMNFLDSVEPNDLRNGESFNQLDSIIENLNKAFYQHFKEDKNHQEFIQKATANLFRENSPAISKAISLSEVYLKTKM